MQQIYDILPTKDGGWKAVLVGTDDLVVSYVNKEKLIDTMAMWADKSGEVIVLRIHGTDGTMDQEMTLGGADDAEE